MKRTLLIDADIIAYQFAATAQKAFKWGGDEPDSITVEPIENVTPLVVNKMAEFKAQLDADQLVMCLSCPTAEGWRIKLLPSYKAGRGVKPVLIEAVKQFMRANWATFERPTLEADDVMGILSTSKTIIPGEKIIVSIDKDMKTIPGWLFDPVKDSKPRLIDGRDADYWHLYQTLVGDTVDNYKGCPGIGPKRATEMLSSETGSPYPKAKAWHRVVEAFVSKGLTEADALLQARIARICRNTDYDFKHKKVKLWTP